MSLTPKRRITAKKLVANRANAARSHGAVTPAGKARSAAANLRHGYYSKSAAGALTVLGEDPVEFKRRLDSLVDACQPANALEMGLVVQAARSLWRMERFHRIAESLAVKHVEKVMAGKRQLDAIASYPLIGKMERLKHFFNVVCLDPDRDVGPEEMQLFEQCRGDVAAAPADDMKSLLLRLRPSGRPTELSAPSASANGSEEVPSAEAEERFAARRELLVLVGKEIEGLEKRFLGSDQASHTTQIERDIILAAALPEAALMNRAEESSLRQVGRATELLRKVKKLAQTEMTIENEG